MDTKHIHTTYHCGHIKYLQNILLWKHNILTTHIIVYIYRIYKTCCFGHITFFTYLHINILIGWTHNLLLFRGSWTKDYQRETWNIHCNHSSLIINQVCLPIFCDKKKLTESGKDKHRRMDNIHWISPMPIHIRDCSDNSLTLKIRKHTKKQNAQVHMRLFRQFVSPPEK